MKLVATPDGTVDRYDRAIWVTTPFDIAINTYGATWGFHVYDNAGAGAVDYDTEKAELAYNVTSWTSDALTYPATWRFAVRAYNATGEEQNIDISMLLLDVNGADVTARPNEPSRVTLTPTAGGKLQLTWSYSTVAEGATPTKFNIYLSPNPIDYSVVYDEEPFVAGSVSSYTWESPALEDGVTYNVAVRSSASVD